MGDAPHGGFDHGFEALARHLRALGQAGPQGLIDRAGQIGINTFHLGVKAVLVRQQARVHLLAHPIHLHHHGLQFVNHLRQSPGLKLQRLEGFLALMGEGKTAQRGCNPGVELLRCQHSFAPTESRHQAQHGGRGHTGHGGAKRQPQALDRRCKGRANRLQVGGALQCKNRAVEGDDHPQKRAQHPQHHQQPHQIRGERGARQAHAFALYARTHRILQ